MIRKNLLQLLFSGAYLWRWNDKLRPTELSEIEKQAHKMLVACALWNEASAEMTPSQRTDLGIKIIEGGLFDYFYRLIITDIKPPVFYKIKENRAHYEQLTRYVLSRLEPMLSPLGDFWERMRGWHLREGAERDLDRRILTAAHLFASRWEFQLIRPHNFFDDEMDFIHNSFERELEAFADLPGMSALMDKNEALGRFANLCGQLRFQIRWTQAPRIPATSVLGHMFIVASCAFFYTREITDSKTRILNNFFSGLFHDFPELLTRDIISPVKQSISGLAGIIKKYEDDELNRRVLGPLKRAGFASLSDRIAYYLGLKLGSEFQACYIKDGEIVAVDDRADCSILDKYGSPECEPKDGFLLKICDWLAAFLEAHNSIRNGVSSSHLQEARSRLKGQLEGAPEIFKMEGLLADFE
ncbi:MAG: HD domain-containing protein [Desulfovibrio sp.]|nr:HD domain-containing protein [Desulfovibrio sp.]